MSQSYRVRLPDGREFGPAPIPLVALWAREGRLTHDTQIVPEDGSAPPIAAAMHPEIGPIFQAPPTIAAPLPSPEAAPMSGLIPYRNPPALAGYYISVFSLVPAFGLLLGPAAVVLGIIGWRRYRREPLCKGAAHSWVAMILGGLTGLANWGLVLLPLIIAAMR